MDSDGRLWVSDTANNRVLRFDNASTKTTGASADGVLGQPKFYSGGFSLTAAGMDYPRGITADSAGRLWVADQGYSRVLWFDDAASLSPGSPASGVLGQMDFTHSYPGTAQSAMNGATGVAVTSAGTLFVADWGKKKLPVSS